MMKVLIVSLILVLVLSGCANETAIPETVVPDPADFSFSLPEGYSIAYAEDFCCSIQRDEDCVAVGGIEVTSLSRKALTEEDSDSVLYYLQNSFHQTNNVEFITFHWGNGDPIKSVNMRVHREDSTQNMFSHYFFEWDTWVYHLWLDTDILGDAQPNDFLSAVTQ